jgi:ornithine decarboxylase antizyme 1
VTDNVSLKSNQTINKSRVREQTISESSYESQASGEGAFERLSSMLADQLVETDAEQDKEISRSMNDLGRLVQNTSCSSSRKQSVCSLSASDSSSDEEEDRKLINNDNNNNNNDDLDESKVESKALTISFKCALSEEKEVEWNTILAKDTLYVDVPASVLPQGSRDSFVSLLEFAEEKLECSRVFVCFRRDRQDRTALMRVFMFLGFSVVPPSATEVTQNDEIMSMVYNIE